MSIVSFLPSRRFIAIAFAMLTMVLQACAATATPAEPMPAPTIVQVIARFKPGSDPSDAAFRARIAASARITQFDLVRPMSGDAWVLRMSCDRGTDARPACDDAIRRVAAIAGVVSIERDGRERHQ